MERLAQKQVNELKKEENNKISEDEDSFVSSSNESLRMIECDSDSDESTVLSTDLPELKTRKIWVQSDDDSSTNDTSSK